MPNKSTYPFFFINYEVMSLLNCPVILQICQIAAYTPAQSYSQYIMPYGDLNPGARRRHNVRVVTVGRYRMLKDTNTHKVLMKNLTSDYFLLKSLVT